MGNFINRHFKKRTVVKCYLVTNDKRVGVHWVIPKGNDVTINRLAFKISEKDFFLSKGTPTYFLNCNMAEPFNPLIVSTDKVYMSAEEWDIVTSTNVAGDIFNATNKKMELATILVLGLVGIVAVLGIVAYLGYNQIEIIITKLNEIREVLRAIGGQ